jgi:Domain of unknown function (DUF1929)/Bacterial Ig domain
MVSPKSNSFRGGRLSTLAEVLTAVVFSALGIASQNVAARGLRPLIYKPQDAHVAEMNARVKVAEMTGQALKFEAPDLMNFEARTFGRRHASSAPLPKKAPDNPLDIISAMVAAIFGPSAIAQGVPGGPQVTGQWETLNYLMPINPIHLSMLRTGNLLITAGSENDPAEEGVSSKAAIWWIGSSTFTQYDNMPWDLFCNGQAAQPDGRIFIFGGTTQYDPFEGNSRATIFDPAIPSYFPFNEVQSMAAGRWYGTATVLGNGSIMAFSGLDGWGNVNQTVEIYSLTKTQQGWSTPVTAPFTPPLYPWLFLLPNGNVFYSGGGWGGWAYATGNPLLNSEIFNVSNKTWTASVPSYYGYPRTYGSAIMLALLPSKNYAPRVMDMGGEGPQGAGGNATTEIIDLSQASPSWQPSGNMPSGGREQMNSVIFPNGKVLALGGSQVNEDPSTATLGADLYDPVAGTWTAGAAEAFPRLYHNTAVLLADGTVIVAGSNPVRGTYEEHIEIYTPPWLFDANGNWIPWSARPQITSAPAKIGYSGTFQLQTPNASGSNLPDVASVVLVRPGSDTHAFDFEQRVVGLNFTASSGTLTVTCPPNSNIAPPGYYMLFLVNNEGVTSIASFLQVRPFPTDQPPTATITTPAGNADVVIQAGQAVSFAGTASSPGGTVAKTWWYFPSGSPSSSTKASTGPIVFPSTGMYVASFTPVDNLGVNDPSPPLRIIQVQPDRLSASINSPASGATVKGTAVSITASASGTTGSSNTFVFVVDNTTKKTVTTAATNAAYSWNSTTVPDGTHTLTVNVTDANGDFGTQSETVTVGN